MQSPVPDQQHARSSTMHMNTDTIKWMMQANKFQDGSLMIESISCYDKHLNGIAWSSNCCSNSSTHTFRQCWALGPPSASRRRRVRPKIPAARPCASEGLSSACSLAVWHGSMWMVQSRGMQILWIIPWETVSSREMNPKSISSAKIES